MSDDEYVYEEDEEYMSDGDDEGNDTLEGLYYDAKDKMDEEPSEAVEGFKLVLETDEGNAKWSWKAMKRLVRVYFGLKRYDEMVGVYKELLNFEFEGKTRNDAEKAINKLLDLTSSQATPAGIVTEMYGATTEFVSTGVRNEKLWFTIKMKSAQALLDAKEYVKCETTLTELKTSCHAPDGPGWDRKKGTQLMTIFAAEIQLYQQLNDLKKLKNLYEAAMSVEGAIPPPRITGIIREAGGKMFMQQDDYEQANEAFFQAFKHYDEAGHPRRIQCLKYLVLANMMSRSSINPFDCQEASPYKTDPEIEVMTGLIEAVTQKDITTFESILKKNKSDIDSDPLIKKYVAPLLVTVRTQVLQLKTKAYTTIHLSYLANDLNIEEEEVEGLLVSMLQDGDLEGGIDQVNGMLHLGCNTTGQERYRALQRWAAQITTLHKTIGSRLQ